MHIVIVGNGPAALSAIEAIRETDAASDITVLTPEADRAYTPCFLAKYVAGTIGADDLALKSDDFYEKHRVDLKTGRAAGRCSGRQLVVLDEGTRVDYDRLLLACGAEPMVPATPDLSGPGVFGFKSLGDAERFARMPRACATPSCSARISLRWEIAEGLTEAGVLVSMVARTTTSCAGSSTPRSRTWSRLT